MGYIFTCDVIIGVCINYFRFYNIKKGDIMSFEIRDNEGSLFNASEKKKTDKHPDYTGMCNVGGKKMNISAWLNTSKNSGKQYLRLKFDEYKPKTEATMEYTTTSSDSAEVPF